MELKRGSIFPEDEVFLNLVTILQSAKTSWKLFTAQENMVFDAQLRFLANGNVQIIFSASQNDFDEFDIDLFWSSPSLLVESCGSKLLFLWKDIIGVTFKHDGDKPVTGEIEYTAFQTDTDLSSFNFISKTRQCKIVWNSGKYATYLFVDKYKAVSMHKSGIELLMTSDKNQSSANKNTISFELQENQFCFYELDVTGDNNLFVLKSQKKLSYDDFIKVKDAVISAYALITGTFLGSSNYLMSLSKVDDLRIKYSQSADTMFSDCRLIDCNHYTNLSSEEILLSADVFGKLVRLLFRNESLRRSCLLITQAGVANGITRGSIASVALETVANELKIKEHKALTLIEDKKIARRLIYELLKVLKSIKKSISKEVYTKLESKIGQIIQQPNAQKLEDPFCALGIILNEEEKYCLDSRNYFLHGSFPKPTNAIYRKLSQQDLIYIVGTRLMMLAGMLLLKKVGFNGRVIDYGLTYVTKMNYLYSGRFIAVKHMGFAHRSLLENDESLGL